jgi:hypothetical protein
MWAEPDGTRILFAPDERVARFVAAVYRFERVEVAPFVARADRCSVHVEVADRVVEIRADRGVPVPGPRPMWLTRWIERPIAALTMGVRTWGTSPTGVHEWYQVARYRRASDATGRRAGSDLGAMAPVAPAVCVGFSEPPKTPSMVELRSVLDDPTGRLDVVLGLA